MRVLLCVISIMIFFKFEAIGQQQTDSIKTKQLKHFILAESALYAGAMTGLGFIWYKDNMSQSFQFFNDNDQWLQMDKIGHAYAAYHLADLNYQLFQNAGIKPKKAMLYSSITAASMMLPIEIFDGFSDSYGASWGDALANTIGAFLPYQQFLFDQNYIYPKFSFSRSPYASLRPNTLGRTFAEELLKDYNGQTYWLSTDFNIFSHENKFPDWLQFSLGYSGNQMIYGSPQENENNQFKSNRQWLLSLDLNLQKLEVEQKWLKIMFNVINKVKIPLPTLEWNGKNVVLHPLYF